MKAFLLITVGAIIVYVALTGRAPAVGQVLRNAIVGGTPGGTSSGNTP